MAPSKRQTKSAPKPPAIDPTKIPTPFTASPLRLRPFLDQLDPAKVYITHIDRHPPEYKKQIFTIPVILNAAIALLILWRTYSAGPTYLAILQTLFGYTSSATVDTLRTTRSEQVTILLRRVGMFALDFSVLYFLGVWPVTFFFEQPANPVSYRWKLGFRKEEVVVRVSRHWGSEDLMQGVKQGQENAFFKTRVLPAIDREFMKKTAYLMMGGSWDLDFQSMLDAHALVERKEVELQDLDRFVLTHMEGHGWVVWQWEGETDVIESRRQKVVKFKSTLTEMGKESLFWRWTEIVEECRDKDGGFTAEGQRVVVKRVQNEFEKEGVDFEEVVKSVGGLD
ncbi:hypothetical protein B0A48_03684 [Cryoendolithus antarcticus]|uniref:Uncharacterized protein n=1 Tax=Cryoendolithus antarcticus TaxID=1507870 RepID=A0A1V8TGK7_9PEZI|nr:hypothetical protein B0A48_03684 [Cryoendolithus antarcticus]